MGSKKRAKKAPKIDNKLVEINVRKFDGLGPHEIKKIRAAVRQVWHRSYSRKLVVLRCTGKDGFFYCEKCKKKTPVLKVDHIKKVGDVDEGFLKRLFCASKFLQGLCKKCHDMKTKQERLDDKWTAMFGG
jgi:hypothetical protein